MEKGKDNKFAISQVPAGKVSCCAGARFLVPTTSIIWHICPVDPLFFHFDTESTPQQSQVKLHQSLPPNNHIN